MPARAAILNMVNSTGYYGSLKCTQKGSDYEKKTVIHINKNFEIQ